MPYLKTITLRDPGLNHCRGQLSCWDSSRRKREEQEEADRLSGQGTLLLQRSCEVVVLRLAGTPAAVGATWAGQL